MGLLNCIIFLDAQFFLMHRAAYIINVFHLFPWQLCLGPELSFDMLLMALVAWYMHMFLL